MFLNRIATSLLGVRTVQTDSFQVRVTATVAAKLLLYDTSIRHELGL